MKALKITNTLIFMSTLMQALPRFAIQEGASCNLCHVDPTGGSLRNDYGITVTSSELAGKEGGERTNNYTGMISEYLRIGGDVRILSYNTEDSGQLKSAIFPMQMDIAALWQISEEFSIFAEQDLMRGQNEGWLMWTGLPFNGYLKTGKDLPAYGLNIDDHTSFIRGGNIRKKGLEFEGLAFTPYLDKPGLVEIGFQFNSINISQSIANTFINGSSSSGIGESLEDKAFTTRVEWWPAIGNMNGLLGGSFLQEGLIQFYGLFGGVSSGNLTWTGAVDIAEEYASTGTVLASYSELNYQLSQGWNVQAKYDFFDEDIDTTGSAISRFTLGAEIFPLPFVEVRCQTRFTDIIGSDAALKPEYLLMIHTWF